MANSIQYAKIASVPSVKVKTNELAGRVRVAFAEYEADAEQSTINMFVLPNGARIVRSRLAHDAMGASTTISVGHAAYVNADGTTVALDVDEYLAATASTGAVGHDVGLGLCCVTVWLCWLCSPCSVLSLVTLGVLVAGF